MGTPRHRHVTTPPLEGERLLVNQGARLETLNEYRRQDQQAAIYEFMLEELGMLRALAAVAHAATHDPTMQLIRASATALRALLDGPPLVGVTQSKAVRELQLEVARVRAESGADDPELIRRLHEVARAEKEKDRRKGLRRGPREALRGAVNDICMRVGAVRDAVPYKESRPLVRSQLVVISKEAWERDHAGATDELREAWLQGWLTELRCAGAARYPLLRAEDALREWLKVAPGLDKYENTVRETMLRVVCPMSAFMDQTGALDAAFAKVATGLRSQSLNPGTSGEWDAEDAAEATERAIMRVAFGEAKERARNTTRMLERRAKREARDSEDDLVATDSPKPPR